MMQTSEPAPSLLQASGAILLLNARFSVPCFAPLKKVRKKLVDADLGRRFRYLTDHVTRPVHSSKVREKNYPQYFRVIPLIDKPANNAREKNAIRSVDVLKHRSS